MEKAYIAIDLKSFYASVECVERGLDPLNTNLVVADVERTDKTICLAVTPTLKALGVPSRPRLFEVISCVAELNEERRRASGRLLGESYIDTELKSHPDMKISYIAAPPRMSLYMKYSRKIYGIYLKYIAPEDIHVYSIDEVFIDATPYVKTYKISPRELAVRIIRDVHRETGITATAGLGTNLYLAKVAMDIVAKKMPADELGVRIAALDEMKYRELLWEHRPLTDFWRVGAGYQKKLAGCGIFTMGDIAERSLFDEGVLYKLFGVNAELLIDHAWGYESCTMSDIKSYRPSSTSISSGQVLSCPYENHRARLVTLEMCDALVLDLVEKGLVTDLITLSIGYDRASLAKYGGRYYGEVARDYLGRDIPPGAHGSVRLQGRTSSTKEIMRAVHELFERITDKTLLVRRITVCAAAVYPECEREDKNKSLQLDIFTDPEALMRGERVRELLYEREKKEQRALISIRRRFGKNAILRGMNYEDGATARERNLQIGGHRA